MLGADPLTTTTHVDDTAVLGQGLTLKLGLQKRLAVDDSFNTCQRIKSNRALGTTFFVDHKFIGVQAILKQLGH